MSPSIGLFVLLSVIFMQTTRNLSDAWLAYWVADLNPTNLSNHRHTSFHFDVTHVLSNNSYNMNGSTAALLNSSISNDANNGANPAGIDFYLAIYAGIAVVNSMITLFRAFIFAYAGIRAAKYIHTNLLQKVFYVREEFRILF